MRVLFCGSGWFPIVDAIRSRLPVGVSIRVRDPRIPFLEELEDADIILPSNARIDAAAIEVPRRLILIQQPAVGTDGVDLTAAKRRGVPVCNAPGMSATSVAEAALFLILALARRLPRARRAFAERTIGVPLGIELAGRTLGLVGIGRSGSVLSRAAQGLGMRVSSVRSTNSRADLLELAACVDVLSVHCPLTPATRGFVDAEVFARMKPGAFLVNVARGPIVDRAALMQALTSGHLGGAGLDVFWEEPWDPDEPLFQRDDVVVLPHVAGSTEEAFARIADIVAGNIARVMAGEELLHRVA